MWEDASAFLVTMTILSSDLLQVCRCSKSCFLHLIYETLKSWQTSARLERLFSTETSNELDAGCLCFKANSQADEKVQLLSREKHVLQVDPSLTAWGHMASNAGVLWGSIYIRQTRHTSIARDAHFPAFVPHRITPTGIAIDKSL